MKMCEICELIKEKAQIEIFKETDLFIVFQAEKDVIAATKEHKAELDNQKKNYMMSCLLYALGRNFRQKWSIELQKSDHFHIIAKNRGETK